MKDPLDKANPRCAYARAAISCYSDVADLNFLTERLGIEPWDTRSLGPLPVPDKRTTVPRRSQWRVQSSGLCDLDGQEVHRHINVVCDTIAPVIKELRRVRETVPMGVVGSIWVRKLGNLPGLDLECGTWARFVAMVDRVSIRFEMLPPEVDPIYAAGAKEHL